MREHSRTRQLLGGDLLSPRCSTSLVHFRVHFDTKTPRIIRAFLVFAQPRESGHVLSYALRRVLVCGLLRSLTRVTKHTYLLFQNPRTCLLPDPLTHKLFHTHTRRFQSSGILYQASF